MDKSEGNLFSEIKIITKIIKELIELLNLLFLDNDDSKFINFYLK